MHVHVHVKCACYEEHVSRACARVGKGRQSATAATCRRLPPQVSTLYQWAVKKSVVGRIDQRPSNPCEACFGTLETIAAEFATMCSASQLCGGKHSAPPCRGQPECTALRAFEITNQLHAPPPTRDGFWRPSLLRFMRDVDAELMGQGRRRARHEPHEGWVANATHERHASSGHGSAGGRSLPSLAHPQALAHLHSHPALARSRSAHGSAEAWGASMQRVPR